MLADQATKEKLAKIQLLEAKEELRRGLPFIHGWPWYKWAREFFESRNKMCLLVAANQISKSSTQIRKCIDWATNVDKWPTLWRTRPMQFWYLYPTKEVADIEVQKKWIPEFLPSGKYKDHPTYGWKIEIRNKHVFAIHFNTGISVYFKTYAQDVQHLQTGTCHAIFADEEMESDIYDELKFRTAATDGYFSMVFTATLGQNFWKEAMEPTSKRSERFPDAWKKCVSIYECLEYEDGSPSPWTIPRIKAIEASCSTNAEVLKRIFGRFVKAEGLKYPTFDRSRHLVPPDDVAKGWPVYSGVDYGSGGDAHPSGIAFVAVKPDYTDTRTIKLWRGDGIGHTTAGDLLIKYRELKWEVQSKGWKIDRQKFDHSAADFGILAEQLGEPFDKAVKAQDLGQAILNTLLKFDRLKIYEDDGADGVEARKLADEFEGLSVGVDKSKAKDDLIDPVRYALSDLPFDLSSFSMEYLGDVLKSAHVPTEVDIRREYFLGHENSQADQEIEKEMEEWNERYEC